MSTTAVKLLQPKSPTENLPQTISKIFTSTAGRLGDRIAFRYTQPKETPEKTKRLFSDTFDQTSYTWNEYSKNGRSFAKALIAQKVRPGDVVTIQGSNSPQWLFANIGTILSGGVSAGIYATNSPELCKNVVLDSAAKVIVVEDESQLRKYEQVTSTALKCIVVWNTIKNQEIKKNFCTPVYSWDEFLQNGKNVSDEKLLKRIENQKPNQPCSIVYTSGTTGNPKGATLTHDNLLWAGNMAGKRFSATPDYRGISYLPLSHIAAQQLDCIAPLIFGYSIDIAPKDALKGTNLRQHIVHAQPTYFLAVPRVWEKFQEAITTQLKKASLFKKMVFSATTGIAKTMCPDFHRLSEKKNSSKLSLYERIRYVFEKSILSLLEAIIFKKIKAALGLDHCKMAASGAGALDPATVRFFDGLNIRIVDLYGLSESSGPATLPGPFGQPVGSCGKALAESEIKINSPDEKGEGEILIKGRNIFQGYWNNVNATKEAIDSEGFFHTGDKGRLDREGNLYITGRIKELIKTSGGENIPPLKIEQKITQEIPIVSQAVVIGDKRNYLTCLLTLKTELDADGNPTDQLSPDVIRTLQSIHSSVTSLRKAADDPEVQKILMKGIQRANQQADSQAQHVQKIKLLPEDFSIANGMLTSTLKLKRSVIEAHYQEQINNMYQ
jgi:long-chain-fatty-acid--CoA ligase ACSBG